MLTPFSLLRSAFGGHGAAYVPLSWMTMVTSSLARNKARAIEGQVPRPSWRTMIRLSGPFGAFDGVWRGRGRAAGCLRLALPRGGAAFVTCFALAASGFVCGLSTCTACRSGVLGGAAGRRASPHNASKPSVTPATTAPAL